MTTTMATAAVMPARPRRSTAIVADSHTNAPVRMGTAKRKLSSLPPATGMPAIWAAPATTVITNHPAISERNSVRAGRRAAESERRATITAPAAASGKAQYRTVWCSRDRNRLFSTTRMWPRTRSPTPPAWWIERKVRPVNTPESAATPNRGPATGATPRRPSRPPRAISHRQNSASPATNTPTANA